jgi:hypothetical protein
MNRRQTILAAIAAPVAMIPVSAAIAAQRADGEAWDLGVALAIDFLNDSSDSGDVGGDNMALDAQYRDGKPLINVMWFYLRKLKELYDDRVDAAFGAVVGEFTSAYSGSWYADELIEEFAAEPIPMVCSRELPT